MNESSNTSAGLIAVAMQRPTLLGVPTMPVLPAPLLLRRAQRVEAAVLAALLGRAYPAETWDTAGTERELFCDEAVKAVLVVEAGGRLIATASLQVHPQAPASGWLRWVTTEQNWRRQGLAKALVVSALKLAEHLGCRETCLRTETDRLAAISLYMQLGFEPLVRNDTERDAWKRLLKTLRTTAPYRERA